MSFTAPVRIIAFSALAALLAACGSSAANENSSANQEAAEAPLLVKTAVAKVEQIPTYFEATGTLASDAESDVAPTIGGKISQVLFDVGSYVKKGDVLVRLDSRDAEIRLQQALSQLEQAKKALLFCINNLNKFLAPKRF